MSSDSTLLFEAIDVVSLTTLSGAAYGLEFLLYCLCARLLYHQLWDSNQEFRRGTALTFALASLVMICTTGLVALGTWAIRLAYIDHSNDPGGPLTYKRMLFWNDAVVDTTKIMTVVVDLVARGVEVWRLWIVWSGTNFNVPITLLPLTIFLFYAGIEITLFTLHNHADPQESRIMIPDLVLGPIITILVTSLVIVRLMLVRKNNIKTIGNSETAAQYLSIIAMLTESYALDSAWSIGMIISFAIQNDASFTLFNRCSIHIEAIAYLLVVYRVSSERAWNSQTARQLSSLRFDDDNPGQSNDTDETTSHATQVQESGTVMDLPLSELRSNV